MNKVVFGVAIVIALLATSCGENAVYDANIEIPQKGWSSDSLATFTVDIADTISPHLIYINIRNTTSYSNSNLYLFVQTNSPSGAMLRDTVEYFLADTKGHWIGKGFGALRDNQFPYKQYIRFPEEGIYTFNLQQGMRTHNLTGVASVGIRIEKATSK
jgi:gliding motility-associated lipoprotein GldH